MGTTNVFTDLIARMAFLFTQAKKEMRITSGQSYIRPGAHYGRGPRVKNLAHCARKAKTLKRRAA